MDISKELAGFEITKCFVRSRKNFAFAAQNFENPDPLEPRPTRAFFFQPEAPSDNQWGFVELDDSTGLHACAATEPEDRFVFVLEDTAVFVAGQGMADYEDDIIMTGTPFISNAKTIPPGRAAAVGPKRQVYVRMAPDSWVRLDRDLNPEGETTPSTEKGFRDISGFAEDDLYACGGNGDIWHYDGSSWNQIQLSTNSPLDRILCASSGMVYILSSAGDVITGRGDVWASFNVDDEIGQRLENIVEFQGQIIISTRTQLLKVDGDRLVDAELGEPDLSSKARLAAADGVLLVSGPRDAAYYDGTEWKMVIATE